MSFAATKKPEPENLSCYPLLESFAVSNQTSVSDFRSSGNRETISEQKTEPHSYVHLGKTTEHPRNLFPKQKQKKKRKQSEKLRQKLKAKLRIVSLLRLLGENEIADSMSLCGQSVEILTCGLHVAGKWTTHHCNVRYCPLCCSRRSSKYLNSYLPAAVAFLKQSSVKLTPVMLTLTQVKIKGESALNAQKRLIDSFKELKRHKFFKEYFAGGIWACENAVNEKGNHLHLHIILFRKKFIDADLIRKQWALVSSGAKNIHIRKCSSVIEGLREAIKYIVKNPISSEDISVNHVRDLLSLKGQRMIGTFGEFYSFNSRFELPEEERQHPRLEAGDCCPNCTNGNLLFSLRMSANELVRFYEQREQSVSIAQMLSGNVRGKPKIIH